MICLILDQLVYSLKMHPICPNHLLINKYLPGEGILAHTDGPIYYPLVAILSLGGSVEFKFNKKTDHDVKNEKESISLYVKPRSLLVFADELYTEYLHSIERVLLLIFIFRMQVDEDFITTKFLNIQNNDPLLNKTVKRVERTSLTIRYIPTKI